MKIPELIFLNLLRNIVTYSILSPSKYVFLLPSYTLLLTALSLLEDVKIPKSSVVFLVTSSGVSNLYSLRKNLILEKQKKRNWRNQESTEVKEELSSLFEQKLQLFCRMGRSIVVQRAFIDVSKLRPLPSNISMRSSQNFRVEDINDQKHPYNRKEH